MEKYKGRRCRGLDHVLPLLCPCGKPSVPIDPSSHRHYDLFIPCPPTLAWIFLCSSIGCHPTNTCSPSGVVAGYHVISCACSGFCGHVTWRARSKVPQHLVCREFVIPRPLYPDGGVTIPSYTPSSR